MGSGIVGTWSLTLAAPPESSLVSLCSAGSSAEEDDTPLHHAAVGIIENAGNTLTGFTAHDKHPGGTGHDLGVTGKLETMPSPLALCSCSVE